MSTASHDWIEKNKSLHKTFTFKTFPSAIAFMVEVALFCEKIDHHPEWKNIYNKIEVLLTTHDAHGITNKDRELAVHMDEVFARASPS